MPVMKQYLYIKVECEYENKYFFDFWCQICKTIFRIGFPVFSVEYIKFQTVVIILKCFVNFNF